MNPLSREVLVSRARGGSLATLGRGLVVLGALLVACGGKTDTTPGGGDDAGSTATCPALPPESGASCTSGGVTCGYGTDPDFQCDTIATCTEGSWAVQIAQTGTPCPTSPPGANGCPESFAEVPVGQSCAVSAECAYPGALCACTFATLGGPVEISKSWVCAQPATGCPESPPRAGSACGEENESCDYGACTVPGAPELECTNGQWVAESVACASDVVPLGAR